METVLQSSAGTLDDSRLRVVDLLRKATGPMHVPQPDGTTMRLCYVGRIQRAMAKINEAPAVAQEMMMPRYRDLVAEAKTAWAAYMDAQRVYAQQCEWAGVTPDLPEVRECDCAVCQGPQAEIRYVEVRFG